MNECNTCGKSTLNKIETESGHTVTVCKTCVKKGKGLKAYTEEGEA